MSSNSEESSSNNEIVKRLDAIISLLLNQEEIQKFKQTEKIEYLTKIKFKNPEIASILNTTLKTVEAQKYKKPKVR